MLIYIVFLMIFVGVTVALYQVYEIHYNINVGNDKKLSKAGKGRLKMLSEQAKVATKTHARTDFDRMAASTLGPEFFDRDIALVAFAEEEAGSYAIPLLRRKKRLSFNGDTEGAEGIRIRVRHLPFWKTTLPHINIRAALITLVIVNCFLVQLLAAMTVYTISYPVSIPLLAWLNQPLVVMLVIYALIFMSLLVSKFDRYMHDLYQLGKLFKKDAV
ncbi:hypothetical protein QEN58_17840 [Halomonas alkaliantarctica]|uniref:Tight adherence protein B n=1 Tax=Halomonas alkaliantarctica TaxID=232346 RepID=A0ABY8LL64_9GAMM|nr:hypothetical protein [Halomonas alkaliantarctica]WGI25171.1 hypothetical protein QEN58_17840 [Halomonas alkaliantarctica]